MLSSAHQTRLVRFSTDLGTFVAGKSSSLGLLTMVAALNHLQDSIEEMKAELYVLGLKAPSWDEEVIFQMYEIQNLRTTDPT